MKRSVSTPMLATSTRSGRRPSSYMRPASHSLTAITLAAPAMPLALSVRMGPRDRFATSPPWAVTTHGVRRVRPASEAMSPVGNR